MTTFAVAGASDQRRLARRLLQLLVLMSVVPATSPVAAKSRGPAQEEGTLKDPRDGKVYRTVKIGSQWIMAENLAYKPSSGGYWAYADNQSNVSKFGYLYDWDTAKTIAPKGWHLPSKEEWETLYKSLSGSEIVYNVGSKQVGNNDMKVYAAIKHGGSSGFNALLGGFRNAAGSYDLLDNFAFFWSASADGSEKAWRFYCYGKVGFADINSHLHGVGSSVRLFKD